MAERYANAYRGVRVCVTGGAGFIGSHLVAALVDLDAEVLIIDDLSNGRVENLEAVRDRVKFIRGSILNSYALDEATRDVHVVFHQAALASVPRSVEEPQLYHEVNATGTLRVLEAARRNGHGDSQARVVYAASSSAYGDQAESPKVESMCPQPRSPYAASKLSGEHLVTAYASSYGLAAVTLRYFNIFGPRQRADSPYAAVIPIFAKSIREGRRPIIYGDGAQTRDFTHVANAVHANLLAGSVSSDRLRGEVINVGCGQSMSVLALAQKLARLLKVETMFEFAPPRVGDVKHSRASILRAGELIGYKPIVGFDEGLRDTVRADR